MKSALYLYVMEEFCFEAGISPLPGRTDRLRVLILPSHNIAERHHAKHQIPR